MAALAAGSVTGRATAPMVLHAPATVVSPVKPALAPVVVTPKPAPVAVPEPTQSERLDGIDDKLTWLIKSQAYLITHPPEKAP